MQLAPEQTTLWPASETLRWQQQCHQQGQQQGWPTRQTPHWRYERDMPWQKKWDLYQEWMPAEQLPLAAVKDVYQLVLCDGCDVDGSGHCICPKDSGVGALENFNLPEIVQRSHASHSREIDVVDDVAHVEVWRALACKLTQLAYAPYLKVPSS